MDIFESKEKAVLKDLFDQVKTYEKELCLTMASKGSCYGTSKKIMVIGRAVNGWEKTKLGNKDFEKVYCSAMQSFRKKDNPMSWVHNTWKNKNKDKYNSARSAFWRVIRKFVIKHTNDSSNWASQIVWSNLYKVSPVAKGNPSESLKKLQLKQCIELLKLEIDYYNPDIILFITDNWFKEFSDIFNQKIHAEKNMFSISEIAQKTVIVAPRPETIKEREWLKQINF
ncbi:hypothetical protein [Sulfuricurvum sp.]|uniref:hypothetical protein n=1 Tax=Sulfuricurvum sp. TaxID=2025608 RepID=UPI00262FBF93|nr:hypothetical protein [Sulfuricurvum sp.]MDD3595216.1 hypothetical protein [Sulfuricurvum sp.]